MFIWKWLPYISENVSRQIQMHKHSRLTHSHHVNVWLDIIKKTKWISKRCTYKSTQSIYQSQNNSYFEFRDNTEKRELNSVKTNGPKNKATNSHHHHIVKSELSNSTTFSVPLSFSRKILNLRENQIVHKKIQNQIHWLNEKRPQKRHSTIDFFIR